MSESQSTADSLRDVQDIRRLMEKSSRFTTLSGLSAIFAGLAALGGAFIAWKLLGKYYGPNIAEWNYEQIEFVRLRQQLYLLAAAVFVVAGIGGFYFTWRKTRSQGLSLWSHSSRRVFWNVAIPLATGALFIWGIMGRGGWALVAPSCLIFYGLALVNAGKFTLADIRNLGYCEILLGLANLYLVQSGFGYGLYFWAFGFGVLHIVYGIIMWYKYDRNVKEAK
jgi:hypothetical protein